MARHPPIERAGAGDLMQLASDVGPAPMHVAALLVLTPAPVFDVAAAQAELARRAAQIPRLRQRLVRVPLGLGRPIWVDDPGFDPAQHVSTLRCPQPGDRTALLDVAATAATTALPQTRPWWRAVFVTGLADGRTAIVLVFHHVLVDGIGGLAILAALADSAAVPHSDGMPSPAAPTRGQLLADSLATRLAAVARLRQAVEQLWAARAELGFSGVESAPKCSLNVPTGPRREIATLSVKLAGIRYVAHRHSATVNDVLLTIVTGALQTLLHARGEDVPELVISVPVSARTSTTVADLGNRVGVMPVRVPLVEPAKARLLHVAALTRIQRTTSRGASAALLGPAFRLLGALGLLRWFVDRQRLVNSFLTNIAGPAERLSFIGSGIEEVVPITVTAGNITVAFAALSYAGSLTLVAIVDPDRGPDREVLDAAVKAQIQLLGLAVAPKEHLTNGH